MKVLLISSLGALLLTGCDNFQLQKPLAVKKVPGFTILQKDGIPQGNNSNQSDVSIAQKAPTLDSTSQTVPAQTAPATAPVNSPAVGAGQSATAAVETTSSPATVETTQAAPAPATTTSNTNVIGQSPLAGLSKSEREAKAQSQSKSQAGDSENTAGTAQSVAADASASGSAQAETSGSASAQPAAPAQTSAPVVAQAEEKNAATAEEKAAGEKSEVAAEKSEAPATEKPDAEKPKAQTVAGSEEKKKNESADQATAPAADAKPATPVAEEKPATPPSPNLMTIVEYINLQTVLQATFGEKAMPIVIKPAIPAGVDKADLKVDFSGTFEKFSYKLSNKETVIAEFKDIKVKLNDFNSYTAKDYEMVAVCSGAKCDMMFVSVIKFDDQRQIIENYPMILKLVEGKYATAAFKTSAEYSADRNTLPDPRKIPLVPQIAISQKLQLYLDTNGSKLIEAIKKQMANDETLAYSDNVLAQPAMVKEKFRPEFSRENGKLTVSAQVQYTGPRKPIDFKTAVSNEPAGVVVQSDIGLSMSVVPRVKDEVYALIMTQQKYTSKIAKVNKAEQVLVCAVIEQEKNQFTECMVVPASVVFSEEGVVEGNSKEKIKATK